MDSSSRTTLWAFLLIAGLLGIACVLLWHDEDNIAKEGYVNFEWLDKIAAESPLISFGPEDVVVSHRWSILSGIYPAVTFRCRFNSPHKVISNAFLCYRPVGSTEWMMVDTRVRRDNTARLILRDLPRKTSYECFFILAGKVLVIRSQVVAFST